MCHLLTGKEGPSKIEDQGSQNIRGLAGPPKMRFWGALKACDVQQSP